MRRRGRTPQVVDTNVVVIANRKGSESYACASACALALRGIKQSGSLVIDALDQILTEYRNNCSITGQPGVGDSFVRWAHDNRARLDLIQAIWLTSSKEPARLFEEFPEHPALANFDPADQKFVAVANAHEARPPILQALDSKWWGWKEALLECGVRVEFLCPREIHDIYSQKFGA